MNTSAGYYSYYIKIMRSDYRSIDDVDMSPGTARAFFAVHSASVFVSALIVARGATRGTTPTTVTLSVTHCFASAVVVTLGLRDGVDTGEIAVIIVGSVCLGCLIFILFGQRWASRRLAGLYVSRARKHVAAQLREAFVAGEVLGQSTLTTPQQYSARARQLFRCLEAHAPGPAAADTSDWRAGAPRMPASRSDEDVHQQHESAPRNDGSDVRREAAAPPAASSQTVPQGENIDALTLTVPAAFGKVDFFVVASSAQRLKGRHQLVLQRVAATFEAEHSRAPTFWIASCCSDPASRAALLPMFAAGCGRALVLFSDDLFRDPLGVLELYSALAIHSEIEVVSVGGVLTGAQSPLFEAAAAAFDVDELLASIGSGDDGRRGCPATETLQRVADDRTERALNEAVRGVTLGSQVKSTFSLGVDAAFQVLESTTPSTDELNTALVDVVSSDVNGVHDQLVSRLLLLGACAAARHPISHMPPLSIVLSRSHPDPSTVRALLSGHCEIDSTVGTAISASKPAMRLVIDALTSMASTGWRSKHDGGTALHSVINACRFGKIDVAQACELSTALLAADSDQLAVQTAGLKTPGDLTMLCTDAIELEKLLTVVVFGSYQLTNPGVQLYRSPTALVLDCKDLLWAQVTTKDGAAAAANTDNTNYIVLKLMSDHDSWRREIVSRAGMRTIADSIVPVLSAATADPNVAESQLLEIDGVEIRRCDPATAAHATAAELMQRYPYALALPKADRNLLEVIDAERIADEPVDVIRGLALKITRAVAAVHSLGLVHGDIKPRNIVRMPGNHYRLIDFDMSIAVAGTAPATTLGLFGQQEIDRTKVEATTAFASPELIKWARSEVRSAVNDAFVGADAARIDIWALGLLLYSLFTGMPLLQSSYDRATDVALKRLLDWDGISPAEDAQVRRLHANDDVTVMLDLLHWTTDPDPAQRPASISEVLDHAFFNPSTGATRSPREVSRAHLTRIAPLGQGRHGDRYIEVWQYTVDQPFSDTPPYQVAAKTLRAESIAGDTRGLLLKEAALQHALDHRNVVKLVGVVTHPIDVPALILFELCPEGSLEDLVCEATPESISVSERLTYCAQVLQGLQYIAARRIVHRSVAARNVLFDTTMTCKIGEFGMATTLHKDGKEYVQLDEQLALRWSAPEVVQEGRYSVQSDVWSFGVLAYEVFACGTLPYAHQFDNLTEVSSYIKEGGKLNRPNPDACPLEVYDQLMLPCFAAEPTGRPAFEELYNVAVKHGAEEDEGALSERAQNRSRKSSFDLRTISGNASLPVDRGLLGPSVHHLAATLVPGVQQAIVAIKRNKGHASQSSFDGLDPADASIWHTVHSFAKPASANTVCPRDGEMGCGYVDTLDGDVNVGKSKALLSYSWGYLVTEVSAALSAWTERTAWNPKRAYVWICSLCLNQHRLGGGDAATPEDLAKEFGDRVVAFGRVLPMLEPWDDPGYVKRAWCLFELYTAIQKRDEVEIDIILSPRQAKSFHDRINTDGTDVHAIDEALAHVHSENAEASVQADLEMIRTLIQQYSGGFGTLNATVKQYLRRWFVSQGGVKVSRATSTSSESKVAHHHRSDHHSSSSLDAFRPPSAESTFKGTGSAESMLKCPGSVRSADGDSVWATTRGSAVAVDDVSSQGFLETNRGQSINSSLMPLTPDDAPSMAGNGLAEVELLVSSLV